MPATQPPSSMWVLFARIFWMALGPLILSLLALDIMRSGKSWFTTTDLGFFVVLAAMLVARWAEFSNGQALTAMAEPATPAHLRRYVWGTVLLGLGVWVLANVVGNYLLPR